eukprot:3225261-Lingulodinium_polyedra.AAC.1
MERFFWHLAERGQGPSLGRAALYGWLHGRAPSPSAEKNNLEGARRALSGWANLFGDVPRNPLPEEVVFILAEDLVEHNEI